MFVVWSVAEHGPTEILVQRLRPLLMKYNVTAYFCGHDHNAQHIHESGISVEYFVTGAAHKTDPSEAHKVSNIYYVDNKLSMDYDYMISYVG